MKRIGLFCAVLWVFGCFGFALLHASTDAEIFGTRKGGFVLIDCASGKATRVNAAECTAKRAPCSTFKIWNTAIGLETGVIKSADEPFWKWDGQGRSIPDWNRDQTLRSAFAASCVPAYQALARKIGTERMKTWLDRIHYGNGDISSGLDVFWLPKPGRTAIQISPNEQAELLRQLVTGKLPFSAQTCAVLKDVMLVRRTERGIFYGKTGTDMNPTTGKPSLGWFVGYVESAGHTYAFAAVIEEEGVMGKDTRAVVEQILTARKLL